MMGVGTLCLVAIAAQSAGLMSVVRFVTTREGWEAQKSQFSAVTSEWEQMSSVTKSKIEQYRQEEVQAEQKRVAAERELEDVLKRLGSAKGELEKTRGQSPNFLCCSWERPKRCPHRVETPGTRSSRSLV